MKFIIVLAISMLLTVTAGTLAKGSRTNNSNLVSPSVAGVTTLLLTESNSSDTISMFDWQIFINNYYGYKIKHPSDVKVKNSRNGDISLQRTNVIDIYISQNILNTNQTINTLIEKEIDSKKATLRDNFVLLNNISPIALSSVTAQTYTSEEYGKRVTKYFIPKNEKEFLVVENTSPSNGSADYVLSEDIIYSLELFP